MSYGMRSGDYFSKYDDRYGSGSRSSGMNRSTMSGSMRYMGDSNSQFRDSFRDSFSRSNSSNFSSMGGFGERRQTMSDYDMGYNDMQGGYNDVRNPRSMLMRGMKRNMSPGSSVFASRPQPSMGMPSGLSASMSTTEALLTLGLQAKKILENQSASPAYGPPAPKMRRLNESFSVRGHGGRGRGLMGRRNMRGGILNKSRGIGNKDKTDRKPRPVPEWKKSPFHCNFCRVGTKNKKEHTEHVRSKTHGTAVKDRELTLQTRLQTLHNNNQALVEESRMRGAMIKFCSTCNLEYSGPLNIHKHSKNHTAKVFLMQVQCPDCEITIPNRIQYERHLVTQYHIRNTIYKLIEEGKHVETDEDFEYPEEYNEEMSLGNQYVCDVKASYCKVCDIIFKTKETKVYQHCKSEEHYNNFKEFVALRKAEIAQKAADAELKSEEGTQKEGEEKGEEDEENGDVEGEEAKEEEEDGGEQEMVDADEDCEMADEEEEAAPAEPAVKKETKSPAKAAPTRATRATRGAK